MLVSSYAVQNMSCLKLKILKRPPPCLYFVLVRLVAIGRQGESVLLAGSRDTLYPAGVGGWGYKKKISTRNLERRNRREQRRFILTPFHLNSPWNCTANQSPVKNHCRWQNLAFHIALRICWSSIVHKMRQSYNVNILFLTTGSCLICGFLSENSRTNRLFWSSEMFSRWEFASVLLSRFLHICECRFVSAFTNAKG